MPSLYDCAKQQAEQMVRDLIHSPNVKFFETLPPKGKSHVYAELPDGRRDELVVWKRNEKDARATSPRCSGFARRRLHTLQGGDGFLVVSTKEGSIGTLALLFAHFNAEEMFSARRNSAARGRLRDLWEGHTSGSRRRWEFFAGSSARLVLHAVQRIERVAGSKTKLGLGRRRVARIVGALMSAPIRHLLPQFGEIVVFSWTVIT